jgi:hypothetical protein
LRKDCYAIKLVATDESIESFQGHHATPDPGQPIDNIPRNLFLVDESSGMRDKYYTMAKTWAKRVYLFGNTWPCSNYFKKSVKGDRANNDPGGDVPRAAGSGYHRKVIHIRAKDSPNVQLAKAQVARGQQPTGEILVPGVMDYDTYVWRTEHWPESERVVSLDANWYEGAADFMFPTPWLDMAEERAAKVRKNRKAQAIGVDSAEGGDNTAWAAVDYLGLIDLVGRKTPDTSVIPGETLAFVRRHNAPYEHTMFDRGGGGKEHVDRMRRDGYQVNSVGFGETATKPRRKGTTSTKDQREQDEQRYTYKSRRAQMYHMARLRLDPTHPQPLALPTELLNRKRDDGGPSLREQLTPIPLWHDSEGQVIMPPKNKRPTLRGKEDTTVTLTELIGCSPDEADAFVLAVYGLTYEATGVALGVPF